MTPEELEDLKAECHYHEDGGFDEDNYDLGSVDALIEYKNALENALLRLARPSGP